YDPDLGLRWIAGRSFVPERSVLAGRRRGVAGRALQNLHRPVRLQRPFRRAVRRPDLRVEKQRYFDASSARSLHLEALSRQDFPDIARDLGRLDSIDGYHLFAPARTAVSNV